MAKMDAIEIADGNDSGFVCLYGCSVFYHIYVWQDLPAYLLVFDRASFARLSYCS
jgi:hypothetical protein